MEKEDVVLAVMASTGLSYDDAAERVNRAISQAQREKTKDERQLSLDEGMQGNEAPAKKGAKK